MVRDAAQGLCDSQRCSKSLSLEEPLLGNGSYAHVRAAGRPARRHRDRGRGVAQVAASRGRHEPRAAVVLRPGGVASRLPGGGAGRSAGVRPPGPAGVAQATLALPGVSTNVDRAAPRSHRPGVRSRHGRRDGRRCRSAGTAARWPKSLPSGSRSGCGTSPTTGSVHCSTPASPTGPSRQPDSTVKSEEPSKPTLLNTPPPATTQPTPPGSAAP